MMKKIFLRSVAILFFMLALSVYLADSSDGCDPKSLFDCGILTIGFLTSLQKMLGWGFIVLLILPGAILWKISNHRN